MAVAAGIISAGTAVFGAVQTHRAAREGREANRAQRAQAQVQQAREIRRGIAQSRVLQARQQAAGQASGVAGGSSVQGAVSSEAAATGANIGWAYQSLGFQNQMFSAQLAQQRLQYQAGLANALSNVAGAFNPYQGNQGWAAGLYNFATRNRVQGN